MKINLPFKYVVAIHGVPRSGTSWLAQILDSSPNVRYKFQPLFSNSFKDRIHIRSSGDEIYKFLTELYHYQDEFLDRTIQKQQGIYPNFEVKKKAPEFLVMKHVRYHYLINHLLEQIPEVKVVGIVRHPCAVLNSWRKAPKEFFPELNFQEQWRFAQDRNYFKPEEYFGFHRWMEVAKMFLWLEQRFKNRFLLIRYEELVRETRRIVEGLFTFLNLELENQTLRFIEKSKTIHQDDTYSVFKGKIDLHQWQKELDEVIIKEVYSALQGTEFEIFLDNVKI